MSNPNVGKTHYYGDACKDITSGQPWGHLTPGLGFAVELGCKCPWEDNNYGRNPDLDMLGWVTRPDCPLHGKEASNDN